jgi:predicted ATPase/class 3 adenylate cyclase/tetratricopeptide (TPR) repeat protein
MSEFKALLLTDVVDSTKLSEALGDDAMAEVWTSHDRAARDLLPAWRGREIDKTDGMLMLFDTAADAVGYAMAYHQALAALPVPLKARAGLHVGPVILRENSAEDVARGAKPLEVDGLAKPTAARVMSVAAGAQTLLTPEAREDLGKTALKVQSHGHWLMKGVSDPIELFEVGEPEARFKAPPDSDKVYRVVKVDDWWMPAKDIPNNLPLQPSAFIGRETEIDDLKEALNGSRLITLLGMGGLGKTRLSLQVAAETIHKFPDGAWFIDLSPIRDAELVVSEAAQVLGVQEEPGRPLLQTFCAHLKTRRVLLIIDNCEHLIKPAADLVHAIVRAAPNVRLMSSSREPLRVPGEKTYPILPLPVPGKDAGVGALLQSTAVRLFIDRVQAQKPSFELTEREAPAVAELVARLEGIPLALELAAARVRAMSITDINARLKDRYRILTGGSRVLQERQQTLRALVDWSYDLLEDNERTVFMRLAVFRGGFDLTAAEAVAGANPLFPEDVLDLLESLVQKSLVMAEDRDEGMRYRMLETLREYAKEKLDGAFETEAAGGRHCEHYFAMVKEANRARVGPEQAQAVQQMETELDNVRGAMSTALEGAGVDQVIAVKLAVALQGFWILRGYGTEGRAYVNSTLALDSVRAMDMANAHALYVGATLASAQGDYAEAQRMLLVCLELRRYLGQPVEIAGTLSSLGWARLHAGDPQGAEEPEREALGLFRGSKQQVGEAITLLHLGLIGFLKGDVESARQELGRSLALARKIGHREVEGECELVLGQIALDLGEVDIATQHLEKSLAVCSSAGDRQGKANARHALGVVALAHGDLGLARQRLAAAVQTLRRCDMRQQAIACLEDLARLLRLEGRGHDAFKLRNSMVDLRHKLNLPRPPDAQRRWTAEIEVLGTEGHNNAAGEELSLDEAIRVALASSDSTLSAA